MEVVGHDKKVGSRERLPERMSRRRTTTWPQQAEISREGGNKERERDNEQKTEPVGKPKGSATSWPQSGRRRVGVATKREGERERERAQEGE